MVMESKTTSKTSCLRALLLRAWRERWTDLQWGIKIKTVLPRGVSGDVYNLADCILQQAVVGTGANQLVLGYLRHSLSAQLVSHAAVLQSISKFNQFNKVHCVLSLLEFIEGMLGGINCCGKPEETVLATAVLSIVLWLLNILQQCKSAANIVEIATRLFKVLLTDEFYMSLICLSRYNDVDLFGETTRKCAELRLSLEDDETLQYVSKLENLDVSLTLPVNSEKWPGCLIQCWLEVILTGSPGATGLTEQLQVFQRLKGYSNARLYAEVMRGSLLALYNVNQTPHESQWGAFAFLKVPHLLSDLARKSETNSIVTAVELILQHSPLLDAMDANSSCSSLKCLLEELAKIRLLTDIQVKHLLEKRKVPTLIKLDSNTSTGIQKIIICAESTLAGILKTFKSADFHKIQDAILSMLNQVLTGKSFELILAVATVQGQLRTLVNRLIRFNECFKAGGDKARAQMFDISFVMLTSIVQNYGATAVLETEGDSLFERWVNNCMVETHRPKAPSQLLKYNDEAMVEQLLQQFNSGDCDLKPTVKLQDVLFSMPGVMQAVLVAWEQGTLAPSDVKRILDAVRGKMCCLAIAAASWLCSYMRTAPQETLLKPMNMVQQLLTSPATEEDSLSDRWLLTCEIIRKMQRDVNLPLQTKGGQHLVSRQPATEQLNGAWSWGITRGWLDHNSAKTLHCLLETAGPRWLVNAVTHELLKLRYREQLQRGVDLALAIFHVDIGPCTFELLSHVLPQLLYIDEQSFTLVEPQLSALAVLTSYCVYTAWDSLTQDFDSDPEIKRQKTSSPPVTTDQLISSLQVLFNIFGSGLLEGQITQQTYFAFNFIKALVEVKIPSANAVLAAIPHDLVSNLLKTLPELFSYSLIVNMYDVQSTAGRVNMAKTLCLLRNYHLRNPRISTSN